MYSTLTDDASARNSKDPPSGHRPSFLPGTAILGDAVTARLLTLIPKLAPVLGPELAAECVDWVCVISDRLQHLEAELLHLRLLVASTESSTGGAGRG